MKVNVIAATLSSGSLMALAACTDAPPRQAQPEQTLAPIARIVAAYDEHPQSVRVRPYQTRNFSGFDNAAFQSGMLEELRAYGLANNLRLELFPDTLPPLSTGDAEDAEPVTVRQADEVGALGYFAPMPRNSYNYVRGFPSDLGRQSGMFNSGFLRRQSAKFCAAESTVDEQPFAAYVAAHEVAHHVDVAFGFSDGIAAHFRANHGAVVSFLTGGDLSFDESLLSSITKENIADLAATIYTEQNHRGPRASRLASFVEAWRWQNLEPDHDTAPYLTRIPDALPPVDMRPPAMNENLDIVEATALAAQMVLDMGPELPVRSARTSYYIVVLANGGQGSPEENRRSFITTRDVEQRLDSMYQGRRAVCPAEPLDSEYYTRLQYSRMALRLPGLE